MSEVPLPYSSNNKTDIERLANFLNGFLGVELFDDIESPPHLVGDYQDFSCDQKLEWYEFTFHQVFGETAREAAGLFGRQLEVLELNLIKRRIINYFKQRGIEYESQNPI